MSEWIAKNAYLSQSEMENNASIVYSYFMGRGWTKNAICGLLGNLQAESSINPGIWESLTKDPEAYYQNNGRYPGYGIVQWTPYTKFKDWAGDDWQTNHRKQLDRIIWEMENRVQYYPTKDYPETFSEFSKSTKSAYYLGGAFLHNYERPAEPNADYRGKLAEKWFEYFGGGTVTGNNPPIWLLFKIAENNRKGRF